MLSWLVFTGGFYHLFAEDVELGWRVSVTKKLQKQCVELAGSKASPLLSPARAVPLPWTAISLGIHFLFSFPPSWIGSESVMLVGSKCSTGKWELDLTPRGRESIPFLCLQTLVVIVGFPWSILSFLSSHFFLFSALATGSITFPLPLSICHFCEHSLALFTFPMTLGLFCVSPPTFFLSSASFSLSNWSKNKPLKGYLYSVSGTIPVACCWTDLFWDLQNVL